MRLGVIYLRRGLDTLPTYCVTISKREWRFVLGVGAALAAITVIFAAKAAPTIYLFYSVLLWYLVFSCYWR